MKVVLGCVRRASEDFSLINAGDRVAVGVSGGKDSLLLLYALSLYRRFAPPFELMAITLKLGFEPFDTAPIRKFCEELSVPYKAVDTDIKQVVFDIRKEKNPCALCAKLRRGALHTAALEEGFDVVALGHHREDAIETLMLSLIYEGRFATFAPKLYLPRRGITLIRPMIYLPEKHAISMSRKLNLPVVHNPCPQNGYSKRQEMKEMLKEMTKTVPNIKERLLDALRKTDQYRLWNNPDILSEDFS